MALFTFTKTRMKRILTDGFSEQLKIVYPAGRFEALQYIISPDLERDDPPALLWLNRRFRILEMVSYIGFRSALLILLLLFAVEMSGFLGDWRSSGGFSYQIIMAIETIALLAMLLSIPFNNSPYWLMEPPNTPYVDKIVGRNPVLRKYREKVRLGGRSETLMEVALYDQYDRAHQQQRQQGDSKLKQARRKKREQKQQR